MLRGWDAGVSDALWRPPSRRALRALLRMRERWKRRCGGARLRTPIALMLRRREAPSRSTRASPESSGSSSAMRSADAFPCSRTPQAIRERAEGSHALPSDASPLPHLRADLRGKGVDHRRRAGPAADRERARDAEAARRAAAPPPGRGGRGARSRGRGRARRPRRSARSRGARPRCARGARPRRAGRRAGPGAG